MMSWVRSLEVSHTVSIHSVFVTFCYVTRQRQFGPEHLKPPAVSASILYFRNQSVGQSTSGRRRQHVNVVYNRSALTLIVNGMLNGMWVYPMLQESLVRNYCKFLWYTLTFYILQILESHHKDSTLRGLKCRICLTGPRKPNFSYYCFHLGGF
jgi:hypothetical protein